MKITMLTGSPHRDGTSALLADQFIQGAQESGHEIFRFDAAFERVWPCIGCDKCGPGMRPCVQRDAMTKLMQPLIEADIFVLVTPLYYFGICAQAKLAIDRFYAFDNQLVGQAKKAILLATSAEDKETTMQALVEHFRAILRYLEWTEAEMILAKGCSTRADIEQTDFPEMAYRLGKSL